MLEVNINIINMCSNYYVYLAELVVINLTYITSNTTLMMSLSVRISVKCHQDIQIVNSLFISALPQIFGFVQNLYVFVCAIA